MKSTQEQSSHEIEIPEEQPSPRQKSLDQIEPEQVQDQPPAQNKKTIRIIIGLLLVVVIMFGFMLLGSEFSLKVISQELQTVLEEKYKCQKILVMDGWIDHGGSLDRWNLIKIQEWIQRNHTIKEMKQFYSQSRKKCGVLRRQDVRLNIVQYYGLQIITFQTIPNSQIIQQLTHIIKQQGLERNVLITYQNLNNKSYAIFHFTRTISQQDLQFKHRSVYIIELNNKLIDFYKKENVNSIGDFGCGFCMYAVNLKNAGFKVQGYDRSQRVGEVTKGFAGVMDFSLMQDVGKRYDWVQSLEAAEQIPQGKIVVYMQNLARHARKGIIISWSPSLKHKQTQQNIIKLLQTLGFKYEEQLTRQFRNRPYMLWYTYTLMIFRRTDLGKFKEIVHNQSPVVPVVQKKVEDLSARIKDIPVMVGSNTFQEYLGGMYFCKDFVYIQDKLETGKSVLLLDAIKIWISKNYDQAELDMIEENSSRKCGFVMKSDVSTFLLRYRGLQLMIFEASVKDTIVDTLLTHVSQQNLDNQIKFIQQKYNGKQYIIIKFFKILKPTNKGYFSGDDEKTVSQQHFFVQGLNTKLLEFYKRQNVRSIVDFGCGLCNYAMNLRAAGYQVQGYDGNPFTLQLTNGFASVLDLSQPRDLGKRYQWVQSFQVGQQIQPQHSMIYIQNLARHATKGIILSWAVVGQQGWYHINNKDNSDVVSLVKIAGFDYDFKATMAFREMSNLMWFKNTVMIFRKSGLVRMDPVPSAENINHRQNPQQPVLIPTQPEQITPPTPQPPPQPSTPKLPQINTQKWSQPQTPVYNTPVQNYLSDKYYCNNFTYIQKQLQPGKNVLMLDVLRDWAGTFHFQEELDLLQESSSRRCGLIRAEDVTIDVVKFRGLEIIAFQSEPNAGIVQLLRNSIPTLKSSVSQTEQNIQKLLILKTEQINNKPYIIIHLHKYLKTTRKGYYSGNDEQNLLAQHLFVEDLNTKLIEFYQRQKIQSIVDFGCGLCTYAMNLRSVGFKVQGYDGNPFTMGITNGFAGVLRLDELIDIKRRFDWVQSFGVAEQIQPDKTMTFIQNLAKHANKGLIISWAIVGQQGWYHVNNRNNYDVINLIQPLGFKYDEQITAEFRNMPNIMWFKNCLMVFRRISSTQEQIGDIDKIKSKAQVFHKQNQGKSLSQLQKFSLMIGPALTQTSNSDYEKYGLQNRIQLAASILDFGFLSRRINYKLLQKQLVNEIGYQVLQFQQNKNLQISFPFIGWTQSQLDQLQKTTIKPFQLAITLSKTPQTLLQYMYYSQKHKITQTKTQLPFCIFTYSSHLNHENSHIQYIQSLKKQNYTNYRVVFVDDFSKENVAYRVYDYLGNYASQVNNRIRVVRNLGYVGELGSMVLWVRRYCGENDIVVVADVNNRFIGSQAFNILNAAYQSSEKWFINTNYLNFFKQKSRYTKSTGSSTLKFASSQYRQIQTPFIMSGLITFKRQLFDKVPIQYFMEYQYDGKSGNAGPRFYVNAWQRFLGYGLLELAGQARVGYIEDYLYLYEVVKETNCEKQEKFYNEYLAKIQTPLKQLTTLSETPQQVANYNISEKLLKKLSEKYQKYTNCKKSMIS